MHGSVCSHSVLFWDWGETSTRISNKEDLDKLVRNCLYIYKDPAGQFSP